MTFGSFKNVTAKRILKEATTEESKAGTFEKFWKGYVITEFNSNINVYMYGELVGRLIK
jgi:hypothetical protein